MGLLAWIILGLLAGFIAKAIMPGRDPGGVIITILLGIGGALLGGFIGNAILGAGLTGFTFWSLLLAIAGAVLLLWLYRLAVRRPRTRTV